MVESVRVKSGYPGTGIISDRRHPLRLLAIQAFINNCVGQMLKTLRL